MKILSYLGWGIAHERQGVPCQDAVGYAFHDNGNVIAVLSDGASGSRFAREAAQANVDAVIDYFREHTARWFRGLTPREGARSITMYCLQRLRQQAVVLGGCAGGDLCATLQFALWDGEILTLGHLGDGFAMAVDAKGQTDRLCMPERRAGQRMWFTVQQDAPDHLQLHHCEADSFLLTSDGACGMLLGWSEGREEHAAGILIDLVRRGEIETAEDLASFLNAMAAQPGDRLDDWSFLIGCPGMNTPCVEYPVVSMFHEEREKIK